MVKMCDASIACKKKEEEGKNEYVVSASQLHPFGVRGGYQ